jgi:NAD(P)-dependent dehydrogenase (short-subunit alcohol dehydrogenase family)
MRTIVIGAGQGLGLELVQELAGRGHRVVAGLRRDEVPEQIAKLEAEHPERVAHVKCDVTDEGQLSKAADFARGVLGEADVVINCAGILLDRDRKNPLHQMEIEDLRKTFEVNLIGAVAAVKHFYPVMSKDGGASFITVTSEGCDIGNCGTWIPAYALSKCAETKISGIMNETVKDVRFYSVHPGRMRTVMGRETWNMEAADAAKSMCEMLESGEIHRKDTWYMDYKGMDMMPKC